MDSLKKQIKRLKASEKTKHALRQLIKLSEGFSKTVVGVVEVQVALEVHNVHRELQGIPDHFHFRHGDDRVDDTVIGYIGLINSTRSTPWGSALNLLKTNYKPSQFPKFTAL